MLVRASRTCACSSPAHHTMRSWWSAPRQDHASWPQLHTALLLVSAGSSHTDRSKPPALAAPPAPLAPGLVHQLALVRELEVRPAALGTAGGRGDLLRVKGGGLVVFGD